MSKQCAVSSGIRNSGILMNQDSSHIQYKFMNSTFLVHPQKPSTALHGVLHIQNDMNHLMTFPHKYILITDIRIQYFSAVCTNTHVEPDTYVKGRILSLLHE
jgi:hypothetical protein